MHINDLPPELLAKILTLDLRNNNSEGRMFFKTDPLAATKVCRLWREVALGCVECWSTHWAAFPATSKEDSEMDVMKSSMNRLQQWVRNLNGRAPMDLCLRFAVSFNPAAMAEVCAFLLNDLPNLRMYAEQIYSGILFPLLYFIPREKYATLTPLRLGHLPDTGRGTWPKDFGVQMPNLRLLYLIVDPDLFPFLLKFDCPKLETLILGTFKFGEGYYPFS